VYGDVFCDYSFNTDFDLGEKLAHLILVPNPKHNLNGDFALEGNVVLNDSDIKYTFSGIGYYSPKLFSELEYGKSALAPLLRDAVKSEKVSGELYKNIWHDIGTPQRLENINND